MPRFFTDRDSFDGCRHFELVDACLVGCFEFRLVLASANAAAGCA